MIIEFDIYHTSDNRLRPRLNPFGIIILILLYLYIRDRIIYLRLIETVFARYRLAVL